MWTTRKARASGIRLAVFAVLMGGYQAAVSGPGFASGNDDAGARAQAAAAKAGGSAPAICNTCEPPDDPPPTPRPTPRPTPTPPPRPTFVQLMNRFTPYDINGDTVKEINSLKPLFPNPEPYYSTPNGVVIVLVDPKLVTDDPNIQMSRFEMSMWMSILGMDISADGFFPYFVEASVYDGAAHQDGWTVLALRRFLKDVRANYPLAGVLLVGSFPDASIVRSVFVKSQSYADSPIDLTSGPEPVDGSRRALPGPRRRVHHAARGDRAGRPRRQLGGALPAVGDPDRLPGAAARGFGGLPPGRQILVTPHFNRQAGRHLPGRLLHRGPPGHAAERVPGPAAHAIWSLKSRAPRRATRTSRCPTASRGRRSWSAASIPSAWRSCPPRRPDLDGKSPLDASGRPQRLRYSYATSITWVRDRSLERKLVADYVARSHSFRLGNDNGIFRTSAIRALDSGLVTPGSFNTLLRRSSDHFSPSIGTDNATLEGYVEWLKVPAVLRGIAAHSNPVISQFGVSDPLDVEYATGGLDFYGSHVWRWVGRQQGAEWVLEPSFSGMTRDANFHIHRTMFENHVLQGMGQVFYVHEGCEVIRPSNAETLPYNHPMYGQANSSGAVANGESLMFYANGLGLMARNKVFNDMPNGFYDAIKTTGRFGAGWKNYFLTEANTSGLNERALDPTVVSPGSDRRWRTLQRKRSYFWSTIGDPTLKIEY